MLDAGDARKGLVDEVLEKPFKIRNLNIELHVIAIEVILLELQQVVSLLLEPLHDVVESLAQILHTVQRVLRQR